jgi:hypothetical protein
VSSVFIAWCIERVDLTFEKHGMTPEPMEEARFQRFLAGRTRRPGVYDETDPKKLQDQINHLSDLLVLVIRERDKLIAANAVLIRKLHQLRYTNLKFWILSGVVVAQCGVVGFLAEQLFSRLKLK